MSEYENSSLKSYSNIVNMNNQNNEDLNSSSNDITNNNSISNNGNLINLSGIDLSSKEGILLLNDVYQKYPNLTNINISNCNLNILPKELFNFKDISSLDIRNNKFQNFEKLIQDLSNFSNLIDLYIDLDDQNQVLSALSKIPKLTLLNGKSTKSPSTIVDVEVKDIEDVSLENNLDDYNEIVNYLNKMDKSNSFVNKFQKKLYAEGEKIKDCLSKNVPNYIYANVSLKSQVDLQKILAEKFLEYLNEENGIIGNFLFKVIFLTCDKLVELINRLYPKIEEKTQNLRKELEEAWKAAGEISDYETKYKTILNTKNILESNIELLQKKINKLEKENKMLTQKINKSAKETIKKNDKANKKLSFNSKSSLERNSYQNNMCNRTSSNLDNSKELKNIKNAHNNNLYNNQNQSYQKQYMNTTNNNNKNYTYDINNPNNLNHNTSYNQEINNNNNLTLNPNRKPLSIKITKDIINELYNSKSNYDKICFENKLPNETLEQYMYTFLNNKYGLKNLVIDWASAIINAIKLYSNEDCDIKLFGKILKNEQEEDSRKILIKLKDNIAELLEYYYKTKHPFKPQKEIKKIMNEKKNGVLLEEEWKGIIYYLYNDEDSQIIENKIMEFIQEQNNKLLFIIENGEDVNNDRFITYQNNNTSIERNNLTKRLNNNLTDVFLTDKKKVTREDLCNINKLKEEANIPYKDFIQIVCENQIQNREKYLKKFVNLFRKFDKDGDGVLNEEQFIEMVKNIPYCQNNIEEYLNRFLYKIDPFNHKKFTFNNCLTLFSSEIIFDENNLSQTNLSQGFTNFETPNIGLNIQNETSLLDKICLGN